MLKYFFIVYGFIALMILAIFGIPGSRFERPPFRLFPDMDEQDKVKSQKPSEFFEDGHGFTSSGCGHDSEFRRRWRLFG